MKKFLLSILLLLVTTSALADVSSVASNEAAKLTYVSPSDLSIAYLSQIFGKVGNVLYGTTGQIIGRMFDVFNKAVLVVAVLWLAYSVVTFSLRASMEGSFLGQNRSLPMIFLRIVAGFILIIPSSVTGYSLLQDIFMKVVVSGVALADQTWDTALNYIQYGGQLYIKPKNLQNDTDIVKKALGTVTSTSVGNGYVAKILASEICMARATGGQNLIQFYKPASSAGTVTFPNAAQGSQAKNVAHISSIAAKYSANAVPTGADYSDTLAGCGNAKAYESAVKYSGAPQAQFNMVSNHALFNLVNDLWPVARAIYASNSDSVSQSDKAGWALSNNQIAKQVFSAILAYTSTMSAFQHSVGVKYSIKKYDYHCTISGSNNAVSCSSTPSHPNGTLVTSGTAYAPPPAPAGHNDCDSEQAEVNRGCWKTVYKVSSSMTGGVKKQKLYDDTFASAKDQGWIMAGRFFWDVEQSNGAAQASSISNLSPTVNAADSSSSAAGASSPTNYPLTWLQTTLDAPLSPTLGDNPPATQNLSKGVDALWQQYINTQESDPANTAPQISAVTDLSTGNATVDAIGELTANKLNDAIGLLAQAQTNYNPIALLMTTGRNLIQAAVNAWLGAFFITFGVAFAAGVCDGMSPGGLVLKVLVTWIKGILSALCAVLLVPGFILGYYVPLYPFALYTFAAVGWFVMVIEGMAAAPLVCVGLTHPEGHDFLGKAEQALMLFLSIFLRPALMVIGLIAAMILSFVAFKMLLTGFTGVVSNFMTDQGSGFSATSGFVNLFSVAIVLVVFGMLTMEVIEQSYKLIYQLPNNIMRWIGGPQMGEEYGQMAQAVKGAVSGVGQGAQSAGKEMMGAAESGKDLGQAINQKMKDRAKNKSRSIKSK